jgi:hypothetical protein
MAEVKTTGFPPTFLNAYINQQLIDFNILSQTSLALPAPFVPAQYPTNIEDMYSDLISLSSQTGDGTEPTLIIYDRLMRFRPTPFYRNKREQLIYFIYSTSVENLIGAVRVITDALDREDAAAQDVNKWLMENPITNIPTNVFFHNIRVYQADESRDVAELASARTLFVNKIIVEYDYHVKDTITIGGVSYQNPYT